MGAFIFECVLYLGVFIFLGVLFCWGAFFYLLGAFFYLGAFFCHAVDGGWSEWSEWTPCSKSCDGGTTVRNRSCDSPLPGNGGRQCIGAPVQEKVCNTGRCPGEFPYLLVRRWYG